MKDLNKKVPVGYRPRLTKAEREIMSTYRAYPTGENILIIGDTHFPFTHKGYLAFCKEQYDKFNCTRVIHIGDLIDNNAVSYHEVDPDGLNSGGELDLARTMAQKWYAVFPKMQILYGNHDRLVLRKAYSSKIPREWVRTFQEVLGVPGWEFVDSIDLHGVQFVHGDGGGQARARVKAELSSVICGHYHTQQYVEMTPSKRHGYSFSMQVGCGIDADSYAMAYAKRGKSPALGCGLLLNDGKIPIIVPMDSDFGLIKIKDNTLNNL